MCHIHTKPLCPFIVFVFFRLASSLPLYYSLECDVYWSNQPHSSHLVRAWWRNRCCCHKCRRWFDKTESARWICLLFLVQNFTYPFFVCMVCVCGCDSAFLFSLCPWSPTKDIIGDLETLVHAQNYLEALKGTSSVRMWQHEIELMFSFRSTCCDERVCCCWYQDNQSGKCDASCRRIFAEISCAIECSDATWRQYDFACCGRLVVPSS